MKHVAPERWNDAWAGRVGAAEHAKMTRHAESCPRCALARTRVTGASGNFAHLRAQSSPELGWDSIRARVHWSVSSERRAGRRTTDSRSRAFQFGALGLAAASAVALGIFTLRAGPVPSQPASPPVAVRDPGAPVAHPVVPPAPTPAALAGLVSRVNGDVMIDGVRPTDLFERRLVAGDVIATGNGRVDVQFGAASAFQLAPRSTLELHRFDSETIELTIDGTVDVQVGPRAHGQRFVVHAGAHDIEVRGTQFRVTHDRSNTEVACRHGLVAVRDAKGQVEVGGERGVTVHADHPVAGEPVVALTAEQLASLASTTPYALSLWTDADVLVHSSSPLEVTGTNHRDIRVDGIEHGVAPLRIRVMPGRHTVEAADSAGRFRRIGWIDVVLAAAARLEIPVEATPSADIGARKKQLRTGIDQLRVAKCLRPIVKAGLSDTYVHIEIAVDAGGAIGFLNVLDTDLGSAVSSCVREVLADVHFGAGAAATWRERIDL